MGADDQDIMLFLSVERVKFPALGRSGGLSGAPGRIRMGSNGENLPGKGEVRIPAGETLVFETPGGGGLGVPSDRDSEAVRRDVEEGLVSPHAARTIYGRVP